MINLQIQVHSVMQRPSNGKHQIQLSTVLVSVKCITLMHPSIGQSVAFYESNNHHVQNG